MSAPTVRSSSLRFWASNSSGERAALEQPLELLELGGDVGGGRLRRLAELALLVVLHLLVDQVLDPLRVADVGEPLLAVLAARFDQAGRRRR